MGRPCGATWNFEWGGWEWRAWSSHRGEWHCNPSAITAYKRRRAMLLYAFHFGLLATSNSFGDVSDIISVGNPLVSWSQQPAKLPDHAVLDTGICFQTSGSVQSINGHFSERGDPSWPRFLVLEPSITATRRNGKLEVLKLCSKQNASGAIDYP